MVEHNSFTDGHGIVVNGSNLLTSPFSISYNDFLNVGRYNTVELIGPVHTDKVLAPGGTVRWNRSTATYGQSVIEDAFGIYQTNGASGNPIDISHNLVNGVYPYSDVVPVSPALRSTSVTAVAPGSTGTTTWLSTSRMLVSQSRRGMTSSTATRSPCKTGVPGSRTLGRSSPRSSARAPRHGRTRRTRHRRD